MKTRYHRLKAPALGLLALLPALSAPAQSSSNQTAEIEALKQQLATLSSRLSELESQQQATDKTVAATETKVSSLPDVSFGRRGVIVESPDKNYWFRLDGIFQADSRWYLGDSLGDGTDKFIIRRARPSIRGRLFNDWDFRVQYELTNNTLLDAYLRYTYSPELAIAVGKMKTGVGLERLQSPANLTSIERGLASNLTPTRDIGAELQGKLVNSTVTYQVGLFNGAANNLVQPNNDFNNPKTVAGRVFFQPWINDKDSALQGLGFGLGGSIGRDGGTNANNTLPTQLSPGQLAFFTYGGAASASGWHSRINPNLYYYNGPFGILAEAIYDQQDVSSAANGQQNVGTWGWTITPSWAINGTNSYNGVRIDKGSRLSEGGSGAWLIGLRSAGINVDSKAIPYANAAAWPNAAASARTAINFGGDLSWYPDDNLRVMISYDNTVFSNNINPNTKLPTEHALFTRVQVAF